MASFKVYICVLFVTFFALFSQIAMAQDDMIIENETIDEHDTVIPETVKPTLPIELDMDNIQIPQFEDLPVLPKPEEFKPSIALGNQVGIFIPNWLLGIVLVGFIGGMGYLVLHILNAQRDHDMKAINKQKMKAERRASKASKTSKTNKAYL